MARARLISTSLGSSRRFCRLHTGGNPLSEFCQVLFIVLVVNSDDFGRAEADPFTVKHKFFPGSPRTEDEFEAALQSLAAVGLIKLYEADGNRYLVIEKFEDHQSGLHKRTKSRFPAPILNSDNKSTSGISGNFPEIPSEEKGRDSEYESETNRKEGKGEQMRACGSSGGRETRTLAQVGLGSGNGKGEDFRKHPAVSLYRERFKIQPTAFVQEQIAQSIGADLSGWNAVLDYWELNHHRPESIGKMLDRYREVRDGGGVANAAQQFGRRETQSERNVRNIRESLERFGAGSNPDPDHSQKPGRLPPADRKRG